MADLRLSKAGKHQAHYYLVNTRQFDLLVENVFADEVTTDYTAMFGGRPKTCSAAEQMQNWRDTMGNGLLSLPAQSPRDWPGDFDDGIVTVHANVIAYLRRRTPDDTVLETRNGGRIETVMQRGFMSPVHDAAVDNAEWRVRAFKAIPVWDEGGEEFWNGL